MAFPLLAAEVGRRPGDPLTAYHAWFCANRAREIVGLIRAYFSGDSGGDVTFSVPGVWDSPPGVDRPMHQMVCGVSLGQPLSQQENAARNIDDLYDAMAAIRNSNRRNGALCRSAESYDYWPQSLNIPWDVLCQEIDKLGAMFGWQGVLTGDRKPGLFSDVRYCRKTLQVPATLLDAIDRAAERVQTVCKQAHEGGSLDGVPPLGRSSRQIIAHSPDFRSVNWYGTVYEFTGNQAIVVKVLWEAFHSGVPVVGDQTLLEAIDSEAPPDLEFEISAEAARHRISKFARMGKNDCPWRHEGDSPTEAALVNKNLFSCAKSYS